MILIAKLSSPLQVTSDFGDARDGQRWKEGWKEISDFNFRCNSVQTSTAIVALWDDDVQCPAILPRDISPRQLRCRRGFYGCTQVCHEIDR